MVRLLATVAVFLGGVLSSAPSPAADPGKKPDAEKAWQETELKKFQGRWTAFREEKIDREETRRRWVNLEFADGEMKIVFRDENRKEVWDGLPLKVVGVERDEARASVARLKLDRAEVYYDFVGEKLILVGGIAGRPYCGFQLSGEYKRVEKPK